MLGAVLPNPLKVVLVSGTLKIDGSRGDKKFNLSTRLSLDYLDIRTGAWNVCLKNIWFSPKTQLMEDHICTISTNIVDGNFINRFNCVEVFYPPLESFILKPNLISFANPTWLQINSASSVVDLNIDFFPKLKPGVVVDQDTEVSATLLFQRLH